MAVEPRPQSVDALQSGTQPDEGAHPGGFDVAAVPLGHPRYDSVADEVRLVRPTAAPKTATLAFAVRRSFVLITPQLLRLFVGADFFECLGFNLTNTLAGNSKLLPHLFKRVVDTVLEAIS